MASQKLTVDNLEVLSLQAAYDPKTATRVSETPSFMKYESQHFRCKAQLRINEGIVDKNWSIGLVQACESMLLENRYGQEGSSFWEFHPLKSGRHKMVNDSDGRQYPFYSLTTSKVELPKSVVSDSAVNLYFEDHFYPTVAWEMPSNYRAKLTDVIRVQNFLVWLVAIKRTTSRGLPNEPINPKYDQIHILETVRWRYNLHMTFDPEQPIGRRLQNIYDTQEELPHVLERNVPISLSALSPPHCNAAQSLIWYPANKNSRAQLLVPPRQAIVPWDIWAHEMIPGGKLYARHPEPFKMVGQWKHDREIGVLQEPMVGKASSRKDTTSRFSRNIFGKLAVVNSSNEIPPDEFP